MSTNYYWHQQICDHCHRSNPIHVGKSSGGWSFGFRGWPHPSIPGAAESDSPFDVPVMARADWREVFATGNGRLVSEYGTPVDDALAWIDALPAPDKEQRDKENFMYGSRTAVDRDPEGFRVITTEFS